jgi:hypothetical protein
LANLKASRVTEIFIDCLFREEELVNGRPTIEPIIVNGLTVDAGFNPDRVKQHADEIGELCEEIPDSFRNELGESFLAMCYDKHGNHWGEHHNMQELMLLGMAIGKLERKVAINPFSMTNVHLMGSQSIKSESRDLLPLRVEL